MFQEDAPLQLANQTLSMVIMMLKPLNSTILPSTNHGYYGGVVEIQFNCCL